METTNSITNSKDVTLNSRGKCHICLVDVCVMKMPERKLAIAQRIIERVPVCVP